MIKLTNDQFTKLENRIKKTAETFLTDYELGYFLSQEDAFDTLAMRIIEDLVAEALLEEPQLPLAPVFFPQDQ